jgi:hypothetical protein
MYGYITGRLLPKKTTRRAFALALRGVFEAAKFTAPYAGRAVVTGAPAAAGAAAAYPITTGAALGLGALATPPGQELLAMAEQRGREDRDRFNFALDYLGEAVQDPTFRTEVKKRAKKKVSKYNKAVSMGMKALKSSKFDGVKGSLRNPQSSFKKVNKTVSKMNKGQKVSSKGAIGAIKRGAGKVLGAIKKTKPRRGFLEKRYGNPFDK